MLVFIVRSVSFKVFIIVKILPGKEYKTAFPFGMLTKLLGVHNSYACSSALYGKRSSIIQEEKHTVLIFDRSVAAECNGVSNGDTLPKFWLRNYQELRGKLLGIFTEVRHCTEVRWIEL